LAIAEKELALKILRAGGTSPAKLGLRFDRVVIAVLGDLRSFVEVATPETLSVIVTISAPIRLPAKTVSDLKTNITARLAAGSRKPDSSSATLHGNSVHIRLLERSTNAPARFIGFVHNPDSAPERLLDLAEHWLRAQI
jgi:hypothetical protein